MNRICERCGNKFWRQARAGRTERYCSRRCGGLAHEQVRDACFRKKYFVNEDTGCWIWTGVVQKSGYARFGAGGVSGRNVLGHRWSYERHVGPIPDGYEIDHLCRNKSCVNPEHLEAVTHAENARRSKARMFCKRGHRMLGVNLYEHEGKRRCNACQKLRQKAYRKGQCVTSLDLQKRWHGEVA